MLQVSQKLTKSSTVLILGRLSGELAQADFWGQSHSDSKDKDGAQHGVRGCIVSPQIRMSMSPSPVP